MDQNYEDWDNDNNSVTSYYVTPPTSPIIQPVSNADETKNFSRNNVNINFSSLSDLMTDQISLWCNFSSTSQQPNQLQLNKDNDNDILISLNDDDDFSTTTNVNVNDDKLIFDNRINNNKFINNIGDNIDDMIKSVIIDDTFSNQDEVHRSNIGSVYTQPTHLKNLPTISTIPSSSLEYFNSLNISKPISSESSSSSSYSIQPQILSKIDISQCHFNYMNDVPPIMLNVNYQGDVAFLYKVGGDLDLNGGGEISCCINGMSDEISIPFNQLCGFKITSEKKIFIKFNPNFKRTYRHHLGGYPYLLDSTILHADPSGGKFNFLRSLTLIPFNSEDFSKLTNIESEIERLWFKKSGVRNEFAKDNRQKLYLTCVFPTERRALAVPMDSSYHKLLSLLESRFDLTIDNINLRFRNKRGDVVVLKSDDCWEMAKNEAYGKNLARLELQIW
ncbi:hypothetical protein C2G38_2223461 [Gigaspora rosea]|uniref:Uncharacterized protein n=1 Tax=Gigaspora rosea TaxID=44941 RepID=A0A397UA89_9GLOM|nr:hypothetical protein C2G38_2223461 [Gigaspora rosea]CAG8670492.1 983_t:CDS:2 [Gigaspora rosea]